MALSLACIGSIAQARHTYTCLTTKPEVMRRCARFQIESSRNNVLTQAAVDAAIEEMLFTGGPLNRRLLGGEGAHSASIQAGSRLLSRR